MASLISGNDIIFVLKCIGVPSSCREREDPKFVGIFKCAELKDYIDDNPECTLFETLRDEEMYSVVRVFFDVDMNAIMDDIDFVQSLEYFIVYVSNFVAEYASKECGIDKQRVIKCMRSNFSMTRSDSKNVSFHLIFPDVYTTLDTLIAMKRPLLELIRTTDNPLIKSIDTAVFRRKTTLRVVGTRKSPSNKSVHVMQPPHNNISDYLFTYVDLHENSVYFNQSNKLSGDTSLTLWEPKFISFKDAIKKVSKLIVNEIINIDDINEDNFTTVPLVIDYVAPCALCKKKSHKHPHYLSLGQEAIRLYKGGNPHSCKVKIIMLEGNRLFAIAQRILEQNVIKLTDRGDYIVWIRNSWRFSNYDDQQITKLILDMRDHLSPEYAMDILCPRKRKVVENNLKDMLLDSVETDNHIDKLPFTNGVFDLNNDVFYSGNEAKEFTCTLSTNYSLSMDRLFDSPEMGELERIIDDIQPRTSENMINRELYEATLSSCLCGTTKPCIIFFYGETATGKSTTKKLLKSAIGNLFIETGQTILTDIMDKGPNPFVANMHLKRAVFCSELPDFSCNGAKKIRSDNIKKLTEPCIVGRPCFSNKINNKNHATIIIDTNYKPVFDKVDNALMRRVALVKFRTHFSQPAGKQAAEKNAAYDKVKILDESLDMKIQKNHYRYAFLRLLIKWYQKYHTKNLSIYPTPEAIPEFIFQLKINSLIIPSSTTHVQLLDELTKVGYVMINDMLVLPPELFKIRLCNHFNVRVHGQDIEQFIIRNKKFVNVSDEYIEYVFIEDIQSK
uniref:DNA-dependent NTPase n=1 Tax=Baiomys poxvirus TaxID=2203081 RepID=A0A2U8U5W3_9POXV|nr:DNA-dependent NTPase [Baiomys poxvirus]